MHKCDIIYREYEIDGDDRCRERLLGFAGVNARGMCNFVYNKGGEIRFAENVGKRLKLLLNFVHIVEPIWNRSFQRRM